jgi:hypothetical protein
LDENSDVLVAGSVGDSTASDSSFVADYRRNILKRNRQEVSVVVHELRLANGLPGPAADKASGLLNARGMVLDYSQTRQLSDALTLTAGMEVKYLDSAQNAGAALPHVDLAYQLDPQTVLTVSYGMMDPGESSTLVDRVSELSTFPRVTMRNYKPRLEDDTHAEVRLERRLGAKSRIEVATYRDAFRDVAVWSIGGLHGLDSAGALQSVLFQPGGDRAVLNGGRYTSLGVRAAYDRQLGPHAGIGVMYSTGDALVVNGEGAGSKANFDPANVPSALRSEFTQAFSGKLSGYLPALKTQIITTYGWLPSGRVTLVDPYGLDRTQLQPFLGLEIRQPLPKIQILPVQIVAVADFRNLLGQGSVSMIRSNGKPVVLTPYCQSFRGGFAVQF